MAMDNGAKRLEPRAATQLDALLEGFQERVERAKLIHSRVSALVGALIGGEPQQGDEAVEAGSNLYGSLGLLVTRMQEMDRALDAIESQLNRLDGIV